jgi:acetoin utilization deacetylase AcuC-like enzyme
MQVVHSPKSLLHNPPYEFLAGSFVDYQEKPDRVRLITKELEKFPELFDFHLAEDIEETRLKELVKLAHSEEYYEYVKRAYEQWVKEGGDEVSTT